MPNINQKSSKVLHDVSMEGSDLIFTVPNLITMIRIVLIIPFIMFFINERYVEAFSCVLASGVSDAVDGFVARKLNQVSKLGKVLDPVADKLTLVAVIICIGCLVPGVLPLVITLVIKDCLMIMGGFYLIKKRIAPPSAKWYGKIATIIFYISVVIIVFTRAFLKIENTLLSGILLGVTVFAMLFALVKYSIIFFELLKEDNNNKITTPEPGVNITDK